jgi:uncharacterized membrane protein
MEKLKTIGVVIIMFIPLILGFVLRAKNWEWLLVVIVQVTFILLAIKISGKGFSGLKF